MKIDITDIIERDGAVKHFVTDVDKLSDRNTAVVSLLSMYRVLFTLKVRFTTMKVSWTFRRKSSGS